MRDAQLFLSMWRWAWVRATVSLTRSAWRNPDPSPNPKSCRLVQRAPCTPEGVPWRGCGDAALGELRVQRVHLLTATKPASSVGPHCRSTACQGPERLRRPGSTLWRRAGWDTGSVSARWLTSSTYMTARPQPPGTPGCAGGGSYAGASTRFTCSWLFCAVTGEFAENVVNSEFGPPKVGCRPSLV